MSRRLPSQSLLMADAAVAALSPPSGMYELPIFQEIVGNGGGGRGSMGFDGYGDVI